MTPTQTMCHSDECLVFETKWAPNSLQLASATSLNGLSIWDVRSNMKTSTINHGCDVLTIDWHDASLILTGAADGLVRSWDLRKASQPLKRFFGHKYAVKKVVVSPHNSAIFLSCSYDLTVRLILVQQSTHCCTAWETK
jgi:WD40 repeat protein